METHTRDQSRNVHTPNLCEGRVRSVGILLASSAPNSFMNGFGNQSGGSLFGQQNSSQSSSGLFGGNSSTGAFGSTQPSQQPGLGASGSSFGSSAPKRTQSVGGMFGSASTGSPASNTGGLFGSSGATNPSGSGPGLFGSAGGNNTNAGTSGLFGGSAASGSTLGLNKPNTSFGANNSSSTGLFGQSNQPTSNAQPGGLFGNNSQSAQPGQSGGGGLLGQSNQQQSTIGGSLFGKPQSGGSGLFGSSKPAASTGGLFGNQNPSGPQQGQGLFGATQPSGSGGGGLFGNSSNTTSNNTGSGLFGNSGANNTSTGGGIFGGASNSSANTGTGGSLLGNNTGGLFGNSNQSNGGASSSTGGLFGTNNAGSSLGSKPASTSMFGSLTEPPQGSQASQQQPLHTTIDQASYVLQGVSPSQKLYTSLTQPAQKRTAHEAHGFTGYASKDTFKAPTRDFTKLPQLHLDPPKSSRASIAGATALDRTATGSTSLSHGEPRQWANSYDKFLKERPTTLTIKREGRRHAALPSPPVSTAPPPIASVLAESSSVSSRMVRDNSVMGERSTVAPIEPDVSLFHRQANNMTVVQLSKKALEEGYYIFPRLESLSAMSKSQLAAVPNLVVGREKFGQIEYPGTVDLSRIANLGDILGTLVVFEAGTVCVYPEEESKAFPGHELNLPCTVTIENAWPIDAVSRKKITDMEDTRIQKHIMRLREKCESDGGEFVTFAQGIWVFKVPHFSKWGLPVEDMVVDAEEDKLIPKSADSSPIIVAVDDQNEPIAVAETDNLDLSGVEDQNMLDTDIEASDPIRDWQDQLNHAAFSCYTASQESLAAATILPDNYDLGAVLLPTKSENTNMQEGVSSSMNNSEVEKNELRQKAKAALHGPLRLDTLRRHAVKSSRDHSSLPFLHTKLGPSILRSLSPEQEGLWSLLTTLYSPDSSDQGELSHWLEKKVASVPLSTHDDVFDTIWGFLTTHKLKEAVDLSLKSNNPHLAVLISLFEGHNVPVADAQMQLRNWKENRCLTSIPSVVRHIWELASGVPPAPSGLNWAQWLGMRLWYSCSSVEDAVSKVPASLIPGSGPELSLIRHAIGSKQLKSVIEELSVIDGFLFLQALDSMSPVTVKQDLKCYDSVCSSLSSMLRDIGEANTAVYVALHIKDTKQCFDAVHDILVHMSDSISLTVTQDLGVPEQLLDEARAAHARRTHDYYKGADYLMRAGLYEQAHQLIITDVAPQAVLDGRLHEIGDLLLSLESQKDHLRRWTLGGEVYLQYLRALNSEDPVERYDIKALCNSCRYAHTPNLSSQAAISIIAKWASSSFFAQNDFGIDVVLNMKFDPSQTRLVALKQASRLLK